MAGVGPKGRTYLTRRNEQRSLRDQTREVPEDHRPVQPGLVGRVEHDVRDMLRMRAQRHGERFVPLGWRCQDGRCAAQAEARHRPSGRSPGSAPEGDSQIHPWLSGRFPAGSQLRFLHPIFLLSIEECPYDATDPDHAPPTCGIHPDRTPGGDRDHRRADRLAVARSPGGAGSGATDVVRQQPQAARPGLEQLPYGQRRLSHGRVHLSGLYPARLHDQWQRLADLGPPFLRAAADL